jgi:hypothetical protein
MPSSAVRSFAYDETRNELTVTFAGGRVYIYSLVAADVAAALATSESKGAFFNQNIRDRYPYRRRGTTTEGSLRDALKASRNEN